MDRRQRSARPVDPTATPWAFPEPADLPQGEDLIAVGADLEPGTLLTAYASGYFPMPVSKRKIGWFHPDPRGVLPPSQLKVSRSLRRSAQRYTTTMNEAFDEVISACADPSRPMGWIDQNIMRAYRRLHHMGWAHSVEVWDDDGLAGGLYGLAVGGLFAGESMFHRRTDASKVALIRLIETIGTENDVLLDVQWMTPHLASLGAVEIPREVYLELLRPALARDFPPDLFV